MVATVATVLLTCVALSSDMASANPPRNTFWLRLKDSHDSPAVARKVLRGLGTIALRDNNRDAYLVKVEKRLRYTTVLRNLKRQEGVEDVIGNADQIVESPPDMASYGALDLYIDAAKRSHEQREKLQFRLGRERDEDEEEGEERGDAHVDFLEAYKRFVRHRAFPEDSFDPMAYASGVAQRDQLPVGRLPSEEGRTKDGLAPGYTWTFLGPRNLDVPYTTYYGVRPLAGRVSRVAFDPTTAGKWYVAGALGGLFRTTDSGVNWTSLSQNFETLAISSIAIAPSNGNVIYVGGGDAHGGMSLYSFGVMKTTDGGATWTKLTVPFDGSQTVADIVIDPEDNNDVTICAGGRGGYGHIYRSTDAGATWTKRTTTSAVWSDLSIGAKYAGGGRYYYASGGGNPESIWRSADRGATWSKLTTPYTTGSMWACLVAASKVTPGTVYSMFPSRKAIYKSTNAGGTWTDITNDYPQGDEVKPDYNWTQSGYNYSLETSTKTVNNVVSDVIYAGNIDIAFSVNGGTSWRSIGGPTYSSSARIHNDQHALGASPINPNFMLIGNDGGVNSFVYSPGADTWSSQPLNARLPITMFYSGDWHPTNTTYMIGGTQDNATPVALGDLSNWDNVVGGDGAGALINPSLPANQYGSWQYYYVRMTTDNWATYTEISPPMGISGERVPFIGGMWMDPTNTNVVYMGSQYLYRFTRSGSSGTWESRLASARNFGPDNPAVAGSDVGNISKVAVAKTDSNRIYVGTDNGLLWMSTDRGATWAQIQTGSTSIPGRAIMDISVNPSNRFDVLVTLGGTGTGHVYRCSNTGAATRVWTNVSGTGGTALPDVSTNTIARDPYTAAIWYVGTDIGVFMTRDSGSTWSNIGLPKGLPNVQVNVLKCIPGTGYLQAATWGRGMWRIKIQNTNYAPIANFKILSPVIFAGKTTKGVVTLQYPPELAQTITISGGNGVVTHHQSIGVRPGDQEVEFDITGDWVTSQKSATITVSTSGVTSSDQASITVNPIRDAGFVSQTVPTTMEAGRVYPVSITMKNTGSIVWTAANKDRLASIDGALWTTTRAYLSAADQIAHDQSKTFTFYVTAPTTVGTHPFRWRMVLDGIGWYGDVTPTVSVNVVTPKNDSKFIAQTVPTTMGAGNTYRVFVKYENTGTGTWSRAAGHKLATVNPVYNTTFGTNNRIVLGSVETIAPGQSKSFEFWVTAPTTTGVYPWTWRMQQDGVEWFGPQTDPLRITVGQPSEWATFRSQQVPTVVPRGQKFTVSITMVNTGSVDWTQAAGFRLGSWSPQDNKTWGVNRAFLNTGETVAVGDGRTFDFECTAPTRAGTYEFQWRMLKEGRFFFGNPSDAVKITVQ